MNTQLAALAELLSYPSERTPELAQQVGAEQLRGLEPAALQELYGATFDLQPTCAPYVGHQILGEDTGLRGPFLARLSELYRRDGFAPREELADHVAEVLRYLAIAAPSTERDDLLRDGLLPALRKMIESFEDESNPYRDLLVVVERAVGPSPALAQRGGAR